MSDSPEEMSRVPQPDRSGKYDSLFFRVGGGVSTIGLAIVSFLFYDGRYTEESLAEMAGVVHLRLEGTIVGGAIALLGLLVAVGGPVLYREMA